MNHLSVSRIIVLLVCLAGFCRADEPGEHQPVILEASAAAVHGERLRCGGNTLYNWGGGDRAEWTFALPEGRENQFIVLHYAAPRACTVDYLLDGKAYSADLKATEGWSDVRELSVGSVALEAGPHSLQLTTASEPFINLRCVTVTSRPPPPFSHEYPPLYEKRADWAETLTAMRAAFRKPEVQAAGMHYGRRLKLHLSRADGKALWTDFPKQSDWFLQDNQMHGEWGAGFFDARKDYTHYLNPERDSTLEQKLIEHVLAEMDKPALRQELERLTAGNDSPDNPAWLRLYERACALRRRQRLAPLLRETDKLIYATHMNMGTIYLATETQPCRNGSQLRMIDLSPEAAGKPLADELLFDSNNGIVRDPELSFDGKRLLFAWRKTNKGAGTIGRPAPETGNYKIYELTLADRSLRPLTTDETYGADIEPCYLPNGDIMFSSTRCVHEVTCGWGDCSNLYVMDGEGRYARRVGFDQTQTAFPHLLNDGRVVYTRRDYNDRGQSYAHALFVMNPDGTFQTEYYGNNSMAPTSIQHTRPIPGSHRTMGVAGGYHTTQGGKLVTIDPQKGRQNYDGLTFHNWEPTPLDQVNDENYCRVGEQYAYPYPFDENCLLVSFNPLGAYLTTSSGVLDAHKEQGKMLYHLYYMTLDGRRELLASHPELSCTQAIPVRPRPAPSVRSSQVDYTKKTGVCYVQNVYYGPSAEGIRPGSIKKLRVVKLFYKPITIGGGGWGVPRHQVGPGRKYAGYGWHSVTPVGVGSASFDAKEVLGEVDVHSDGSAMFEVPAREPVYFQLVDEKGRVVQTMRSWAALMPNERFSCVGCHEDNDDAPLPQAMKTAAMQQPPQKLKPVPGITGAPFSYAKAVQPIWNRHCVSCHAPGRRAERIDLSDALVEDGRDHKGNGMTRRKFYQSYLTLLQVKNVSPGNPKSRLDEGRPNEWVNYYTRMATMELTPPYYAGSTRSGLVDMLMEGHEKTELTAEEIGTVAAWIDLNVPFVGEYDEMHVWDDETVGRYNAKVDMRAKQEQIEQKNIEAYIRAGQGAQ